MNSLIQLDSKKHNFSLNINNYKDYEGKTIQLTHPVHLFVQINRAILRIPLTFKKQFYNKYEHNEPIQQCIMGYKVGPCYNTSTNPPQDGAENFVLCCLESKRGNGQFCLRYDYDEEYDSYEMDPFEILHEISVNVSSNGKSENFELSNNHPKKTIKNFGTFQITVNYQINRPNDLKFTHVLFREVKSGRWFYINKYHVNFAKLTITALQYKVFSSCSDPMHSETKTHDNPMFISDQFFPFKNNSLSDLFSPFGNDLQILYDRMFMIQLNVESDMIILDSHLENIE